MHVICDFLPRIRVLFILICDSSFDSGSGEQPKGESASSTPRRIQPEVQVPRPVYRYNRLPGGGAVPTSSIQEDDEMRKRHPELYAEQNKRLLTKSEIDAGNRARKEAEVGDIADDFQPCKSEKEPSASTAQVFQCSIAAPMPQVCQSCLL